MPKNFWEKFNKPIMALAPMAGITDSAFRQMFARYGKPDVMFTEFVSAHGLQSPGRGVLLRDMAFDPVERPLVVQFFGRDPGHFYACAQLAREMGFDGIDINMGCPDKGVLKQKAGAYLINQPELARKLILRTKEGAGDLPVSVKTRIGYGHSLVEEWIPALLEAGPDVITLHGRTKSQVYGGRADWSRIKKTVELRNRAKSRVLIMGNGDIRDLQQAYARVHETGVDGIMAGRGVFGNPWFFNKEMIGKEIPLEQKLRVLIEHTELFEKLYSRDKKFYEMRKHFAWYLKSYPNTKNLKMDLMKAENIEQVRQMIRDYLAQ